MARPKNTTKSDHSLRVTTAIKPATPWNVSLAKLINLEKTIVASEHDAMMARWQFGRELVSRRVDYKGKRIIPTDLMTLVLEKCGLSQTEVTKRVPFADRYPTKELVRNAVTIYPTWHQMVHKGLVETPRTKSTKPTSKHSGRWIIGRLTQEVEKAFAHHSALTREQVKDIEALLDKLQSILNQLDRNDARRAS